nr:MAG TPA: protein of unknown function (DUF5055) [Caudoviricetes sp.]
MAKTITINYEGAEYTLEYTRKSIETMERQGFVLSDIKSRPMSTLPALFAGAFLAHHRYVKKEKVDAIFGNLTNKEVLFEKLAEMYAEPLEALMDEPEENAEGNVTWAMNW